MVRDFIKNKKISRTDFKAASALVVGRGVVKDFATKTVGYPEAETATDIFVVVKERYPEGEACARVDFSDYDEMFMNVAEGDRVKIAQYEAGDSFGVDQMSKTAAPSVGDTVAIGTDGLWKKATVDSRYVYIGEYNDNGHVLKVIEVLETEK